MPVVIQIIIRVIASIFLFISSFFGFGIEPSTDNAQKVPEPKIPPIEIIKETVDTTEDKTKVEEIIKDIGEIIEVTDTSDEDKKNVYDIEEVKEKEPEILKPKQEIPPPTEINFPAEGVDGAILNIVCLSKSGETVTMSTGSGALIDQKGVILTNAHVAEPFLSKNLYKNDCTVKHPYNSLAHFSAKVVYFPSDWSKPLSSNPVGTGENDYALLLITGHKDSAGKLSSTFPFLTMSTSEKSLEIGNDIYIAGYPASNTGSLTNDSNPVLKTDTSSITQNFSFDGNSIDVISSATTSVAQLGSSGGAVVDKGKLIGIIVTTNGSVNGNTLNAITISYINKDFKADTGQSIINFISGL